MGDTSDSRRRQRQSRIGSRIALTVLVALTVTGSAAQQANLYSERNRLLQLREIVWPEITASHYPSKLSTSAKEQVWEHLGSNNAVAGGLERYLISSEAVPQEIATAMRSVLATRVPTIAFEDSRLRFATSIIEARGRVYRENFVDDVDNFVIFAPTQKNGRYIKTAIGRLGWRSPSKVVSLSSVPVYTASAQPIILPLL